MNRLGGAKDCQVKMMVGAESDLAARDELGKILCGKNHSNSLAVHLQVVRDEQVLGGVVVHLHGPLQKQLLEVLQHVLVLLHSSSGDILTQDLVHLHQLLATVARYSRHRSQYKGSTSYSFEFCLEVG